MNQTFNPMRNILILICIVISILSCNNKHPEPISDWDAISPKTYYEIDIFTDLPIYGKWEVISTSGGKTGDGYTQDFDYLLMKPNGIFGLLKDDELIVSGKIKFDSIISQPLPPSLPVISFSSDKSMNIQILNDSIKYVQFVSDTLNLIAPCCDRYNTHLVKVE